MDMKFSVDLEYIGEKIIASKGKEELKEIIEKVFNKGQLSEDNREVEPPAEGEKSIEEKVIDNILDVFF